MPADSAPSASIIDRHVYQYGSPNSTLSFKSSNGDATGSVSHESVVRFVIFLALSHAHLIFSFVI